MDEGLQAISSSPGLGLTGAGSAARLTNQTACLLRALCAPMASGQPSLCIVTLVLTAHRTKPSEDTRTRLGDWIEAAQMPPDQQMAGSARHPHAERAFNGRRTLRNGHCNVEWNAHVLRIADAHNSDYKLPQQDNTNGHSRQWPQQRAGQSQSYLNQQSTTPSPRKSSSRTCTVRHASRTSTAHSLHSGLRCKLSRAPSFRIP